LNSRERVNRAIEFKTPDQVPISHAVLPAAQLKYGEPLAEILTEFRDDFGWDYMNDLPYDEFPPLYKKGLNTDDFGTVWQVECAGICGIPVQFPIKNLENFENYKWPEVFSAGPTNGRQYSGSMAGGEGKWYARGAWITFFEQMQQLRGMENFFMDIAYESKDLLHFMDQMLEFNLTWIDKWIKFEYDGIHFADDWGEQTRLLIKPDTWRRLFKPVYAEMFKKVRDAGKHVWYHTDGHINKILLDFIEIGVDVINCQIAVIGHDWIANNARGKIAFRTDIDRQYVMPFGSPTEVKEEVQRTFEACGGPEGGIIACGEIGPDVPLENVQAMYEAFMEYGTYN
jgi:uroporphyrinogen decarboxylase